MSYLSLKDYGLIGNRTSAALVSRLGSIDWCCLPYLDSPSHFSALLNEAGGPQGGRFQIMPSGEFRSEQRYHQRTHVLETLFETPDGRAVLTDWMPVGNGHSEDPSLCRRIEVIDGHISWSVVCAPQFGDGTQPAKAEHFRGGILFRGPHPGEIAQLRSEVPLELASGGTTAVARFSVEAPARARFRWAWGRRAEIPLFADPFDSIEWWRNWAHHCPGEGGCAFAGPWHDLIARAGLTIKLLVAPYSGALADAVASSAGPVRFRRAWIRDAAMTIQALAALGCSREADAHFSWICDLIARDGAESLQQAYTLDGGRQFPALELEREGLFHLDVYGHVALAASERLANGGDIPERALPGLYAIADFLCQVWRRPDHGPWSSPQGARGKPEHYVASKVMSWVALDRVIEIARQKRQEIPPRWTRERDVLHQTILINGFDERQNTFVRAFSESEADASTLLIPLVGFLPPDDPRVLGTLIAIQEQLGEGALIHHHGERSENDGQATSGGDGAHFQSSFNYVSALAVCGRTDEAADRLAELCSYATPLGLLGDRLGIDREIAGAFPSALAEVALINAGLYVGRARGLQTPLMHVIGEAPPPLIDERDRLFPPHHRRRGFRPLKRAG